MATRTPDLYRVKVVPVNHLQISPLKTQEPIWTDSDGTDVSNWLAAFMDGEQPPPNLVSWIVQLAAQYKLSADDIHQALNAAWNRNARPGRKNRPRFWKWFYEVLRNAFVPGYAARIPEATP